jgi:hypothetical protein
LSAVSMSNLLRILASDQSQKFHRLKYRHPDTSPKK